jgi:tetratricopeptide (TPR) repeat protein
MRTLRSSLLALLLLGAAGTGFSPAQAAPPAPEGLPAAVREARALLRRHRSLEALQRLEAEGGLNPSFPERSWLISQLAPAHRGREAVRAEIARMPRSGLRTALDALLDEDLEGAAAQLVTTLRRQGDTWMWLALATLRLRQGDHAPAAEAAVRARARGPLFVYLEATLIEARALAERGRLGEAIARARQAAGRVPEDSRALSLAAELERRAGRLPEGRAALLAALARDPGSEAYARRLADLLRSEGCSPIDPNLLRAIAALPREENGERVALDALALERLGAPEAEVIARYERALALGAGPTPVEHALRRLLARAGAYARAVDLLRAAIPPDLRDDPLNLLRGRWQALDRAAAASPSRAAPPAAQHALAEALVGVGALDEALAVATAAGAPGAALARRLAAHRAFEEAFEVAVEAGYCDAAYKRATPSLDGLLAHAARIAAEHLPPEDARRLAPTTAGVRRVAILGAWLDHSARTTSPIVAYFREYGRYLVMGQRVDQPPEAILLSLGFLAASLPITTRGQHHRHDVAVGYAREIRSWVDAQGGSLSGACLPDSLWLDADAALASEYDARRALVRDPALLASAQRLPVPAADTLDGPFALGDPAGVGLRLLARYAARHPNGRWGSFGTLRAHESGHVIDIRRHLPLWHGLPATISMLAWVGFAPKRMEAVLERRAQLAAVIDAPDPDLAVEEMVELLPVTERDPEVHAAGYQEALDRLIRHVWSHPALYPQIDRSRRVLPQLDRLTNEQLRQAARAVAGG